jgi:predicted amidophosphoribosyltransferase
MKYLIKKIFKNIMRYKPPQIMLYLVTYYMTKILLNGPFCEIKRFEKTTERIKTLEKSDSNIGSFMFACVFLYDYEGPNKEIFDRYKTLGEKEKDKLLDDLFYGKIKLEE